MPYGLINADTMADSSSGIMSPISSVMRNRIINGQMTIDQRNNGAAVTALSSGVYPVDRFQVYCTTTGLSGNAQQVSTAPVGFVNSLKFTTTAGATSGSTERAQIQQVIEGFNTADLQWGTANAKTVTLSFWVQSSKTGQFGGSVQNYASSRSYPFSYTISVANTWEQKSVTIAGDTTGTWETTNSGGICLNFDLGMGSTLQGTAGSWAATNYRGATGDTSIVATTGATWYVTGVQLEKGSSATGFEYRLYNQELSACQRYYVQFLGNEVYETLGSGMSSTSQQGFIPVPLPVKMRSNPTLSYSTVSLLRWSEISNAYAGTALTLDHSSPYAPFIYLTVASGMTSYRAGFITANNSTSAYVGFSAEL
jgi:hypothetical protein